MAGTAILSLIRNKMVEKILQMNPSLNYNFTWSMVNQKNYALGDFPRAEVYFHEENLDTFSGISAQAYSNKILVEIRVAGKLTISSNNPLFEIDDVLWMALDDLKALFGANAQVDYSCEEILYKGYRKEIAESGDQFIPAKLITRWEILYTQDRLYPQQYASS